MQRFEAMFNMLPEEDGFKINIIPKDFNVTNIYFRFGNVDTVERFDLKIFDILNLDHDMLYLGDFGEERKKAGTDLGMLIEDLIENK